MVPLERRRRGLLLWVVDDNDGCIIDGLDHARHHEGVSEKLLVLRVASESTVDLESFQEP